MLSRKFTVGLSIDSGKFALRGKGGRMFSLRVRTTFGAYISIKFPMLEIISFVGIFKMAIHIDKDYLCHQISIISELSQISFMYTKFKKLDIFQI